MPYVKLVTTKEGWGGVRGQIMEVSEIRAERWCNSLKIAVPATRKEQVLHQDSKKKFEAEKRKNGGGGVMQPVVVRMREPEPDAEPPSDGGDPGDDGGSKKKE